MGSSIANTQLSLFDYESDDEKTTKSPHLIEICEVDDYTGDGRVGLADVEFLGIDHREMHPFHDVEPLVVAVAHKRAERFLGDDLGQHDVLVRLGKLEPRAVEA